MFFPRSDKKAKNTIQIQTSLSKFYTSGTKHSICKVPTLGKEQTFHTELDMPMYLVFLHVRHTRKKKSLISNAQKPLTMPTSCLITYAASKTRRSYRSRELKDIIKHSKGQQAQTAVHTHAQSLTSLPVQWPKAKLCLVDWYTRGKIQNKLSSLPHTKCLLPLRQSSVTLWKHPWVFCESWVLHHHRLL